MKFAYTAGIYSIKIYLKLSESSAGNLELCWSKTLLVFKLNSMGGILWGDIMSERFNTD